MEILRRSGNKLLALLLKDKYFYPLLLLVIIITTWLNWKNEMMTGIIPYYDDYANFFRSGFDSGFEFKKGSPTFPMWGYGFVLLLTKSKFIIILFQQLLAIYTIVKAQSLLKELGLTTSFIAWFRLILLLGFSWFILHTALWPYSIAANLLVLSILYLAKAYSFNMPKYYFISAIMFGLILNFRSDYLYFFFAFSIILIIHHFLLKKKEIRYAFFWITTVFIFLLPWGIYTKNKTDSFLLSSTNGGHVLFISLGQLPGNTWGISPIDSDPKMIEIVESNLGPSSNTLSPAADQLLKSEWKKRITSSPFEFLKKCSNNLYLTIIRPFSNGEIYRQFIQSPDKLESLKSALKTDVSNKAFGSLFKKLFSLEYLGFIIPILLNLLSIFLFGVFVICLMIGLFRYKKVVFSNWLLLSLYTIIGYQVALQTAAFYNPNYHTNMFLFYGIVTAMILSKQKLHNKLCAASAA